MPRLLKTATVLEQFYPDALHEATNDSSLIGNWTRVPAWDCTALITKPSILLLTDLKKKHYLVAIAGKVLVLALCVCKSIRKIVGQHLQQSSRSFQTRLEMVVGSRHYTLDQTVSKSWSLDQTMLWMQDADLPGRKTKLKVISKLKDVPWSPSTIESYYLFSRL